MPFLRLVAPLLLLLTSGCAINFDIGPYDVGAELGDMQGAAPDQCPPDFAGLGIQDLGDMCRVGVTYDGVFVDGSELAADVDAGIAAAATIAGQVTRVRAGSIQVDRAQIVGGNGSPPDVTWRDLDISLTLDGGTEHLESQPQVPNTTGISFNAEMSSADLSVVNDVLDAPTTSNLSGVVYLEGSLTLDDIQTLADAGELSFETSIGANIRVGL